MTRRRSGDEGQAFPVYITVIAGLLLLALVYFAVGQAAATRSGAQTAADAAALAAAQDARDQLRGGWLDVILNPAEWPEYLEGERYGTAESCRRAAVFAAKNDAELSGDACARLDGPRNGFRVTVRTVGTVGESVIPGTENQHATATATAVIEPLCTFEAPDPGPDPEPEPDPDPSATPTEPPESEDPPIQGLSCDGIAWEIDPEDPRLPSVADLFRVRLAD